MLVLLSGCGGSTGTVTGSVTFDGQPILYGMVSLKSAGGRVVSGAIQDGHYQLPNVPLGPAKLSVRVFEPALDRPIIDTADPEAVAKALAAPAPATFEKVDLPPRFHDYEKSGLTLTVEGGSQTHDLALTP